MVLALAGAGASLQLGQGGAAVAFGVVGAALLVGTLLSLRSPAQGSWREAQSLGSGSLRLELDRSRAEIQRLQELVQEAGDIPSSLAAARAEVDRLHEELAKSQVQLDDARADHPSLEQLLDAAWSPGSIQRAPQDQLEFDQLREALQSSERELRITRDALQAWESRDPDDLDDRIRVLRDALRRSEGERALLRAGRPETVWEARSRELERRLRGAEARAAAVGAIAEGEHEIAARIQGAEEARLVAEDRARSSEERAVGLEQRVKELTIEIKTRLTDAEAGVHAAADAEVDRLRAELSRSESRIRDAEARTEELEQTTRAPDDRALVDPAALDALEERIAQAELRARDAERRLAEIPISEEEWATADASDLRRRLSRIASLRKRYGEEPGPAPLAPRMGPLADLQAAVAYELRGPVASLRGLSLALRSAVGAGEGRDLVRQLGTTVRKIDQLVADLSAVAKIADGSIRLRRRRTDLTALVTRVLNEADGLEHRVLLMDGDPVTLSIDPGRVEQIVDSLLANARGRTTKGMGIRVRVSANEDGGAIVAVSDDGNQEPEIGPELSLAVRLAELHGGRLWLEPSTKGASFRVELASGQAEAASGATPA